MMIHTGRTWEDEVYFQTSNVNRMTNSYIYTHNYFYLLENEQRSVYIKTIYMIPFTHLSYTILNILFVCIM